MRIGRFLFGTVIAAPLGLMIFGGNFVAAKDVPADAKGAQIERGKYLTTFGSCHDCHTPKNFTEKGPEPDMSRALSGSPAEMKLPPLPKDVIGPDKWGALGTNDLTAWYGPWGVSFAANLTPDLETGTGSWTEEMFIAALRTGKHLGAPEGRNILPPMPWQFYTLTSDEDLKAIWAYIRTLKPVKNAVPEPLPPQK